MDFINFLASLRRIALTQRNNDDLDSWQKVAVVIVQKSAKEVLTSVTYEYTGMLAVTGGGGGYWQYTTKYKEGRQS